LKNQYQRILKTKEDRLYLSDPKINHNALGTVIQMSPFATFSTSSFFNNFFVSERIEYAPEVRFSDNIVGRYMIITTPSVVVANSNDSLFLMHENLTGFSPVSGSSVAGFSVFSSIFLFSR
jgi:hypothetical protein